jgi:hypothetical protein
MNLLHDFLLWRGDRLWRGVLVLLLCLLPFRLAQAQDAPLPLLLGEFGSASLAEGDAVQYALAIPTDGSYTVAFTGDGDPADFLLTLAGADGSELYNDVLQGETVVDLTAGDYLLTFTAQADADLAFLVGIEGGSMSTDSDAPGELFNGSVFTTEEVTDPLYATLTIAPSSYPQQVLILVQGGDDDVYTAEVTSEDFDYYYTSTDESDLVRFVSSGGVYQLVVTPTTGGASLQVSVFLSGPAPVLALGVETDGELTDAADEDTYQITVEAAGTVVAVTTTAEVDLTLSAGLQPGAESWFVYGYADEPTVLEFIAPEAGVYYITVATEGETGASYTVLAEDRGPAPVLPLDEPTQGTVEASGRLSYLVNVEEPDQFLIVVLAGPADEDLDLSMAQYIDGEEVASDSAASLSSREIVGLFAAEPGVYVVKVDGSWSEGADFVILASTGALADLLGEEAAAPTAENSAESATESTAGATAAGAIEQWAVAAEASSQYTDDSWSAQQATGAPDTPDAGDNATAWAAAAADDQLETLVLVFEQPVNPTAIEIYESFNPGAVAQIEVLDPNTDEWVVVWSGEADTAGQEMAVFSPELTAVDFVTNQVRLTIDEPAIEGWNEIDAVKLIGVSE